VKPSYILLEMKIFESLSVLEAATDTYVSWAGVCWTADGLLVYGFDTFLITVDLNPNGDSKRYVLDLKNPLGLSVSGATIWVIDGEYQLVRMSNGQATTVPYPPGRLHAICVADNGNHAIVVRSFDEQPRLEHWKWHDAQWLNDLEISCSEQSGWDYFKSISISSDGSAWTEPIGDCNYDGFALTTRLARSTKISDSIPCTTTFINGQLIVATDKQISAYDARDGSLLVTHKLALFSKIDGMAVVPMGFVVLCVSNVHAFEYKLEVRRAADLACVWVSEALQVPGPSWASLSHFSIGGPDSTIALTTTAGSVVTIRLNWDQISELSPVIQSFTVNPEIGDVVQIIGGVFVSSETGIVRKIDGKLATIEIHPFGRSTLVVVAIDEIAQKNK
jgi:hypothetical protein